MTTLRNWFLNYRKNSSSWAQSFQGIDVMLLMTVVAMVVFGLIMVYSSSFIYAQEKTGNGFVFIGKQLAFAALGFLTLLFTFRLDYRLWSRWAYFVLAFAIFLLVLILVPGVGEKAGGARRWLHFAGFHFQPAELVKFAVIFFVASLLDRKSDRFGSINRGFLSHLAIPLPALLLLLFQPDFGTTVMIALVVFSLLFVAGVPIRYLFVALLGALVVGAWLAVGTTYRKARIMTFVDPWSDPGGKGFQILQSLIGFHNGRLWGVGLGNGKEKLFYLPEAHNDFIFSVIGEELGFVGIAAVILAYLYFIYRGLRIAWSSEKIHEDRFGMLLATGITLALGFQGFINISVAMGLVPTKGLTLPFMSYGGSALWVDIFAIGVLLSVSRGPKKRVQI